MKPHTPQNPCPICEGHRDLPPGNSRRCYGFTSDAGDYAHCTREEHAGGLPMHPETNGFAHRLRGACKCGRQHGADLRAITEAAREVVTSYDYRDANGRLRYQVVRFHPKTFRQRRPDGDGWSWKLDGVEPVLYRLPELIKAVAAGDTVLIVEGEKDADRLAAEGWPATCNSGGAGKWRESYAPFFAGANVVIIRDKDEPGTKHARQVFASVKEVAASLRVVEARSGKDAYDHFQAGHLMKELVPVWPTTEDLRTSDPAAWKRRLLRFSLDATEPFRVVDLGAALARPAEPKWPTGLEGEASTLPNFRGVVLIAGLPSSGKSVLALASSVQAAWAGWDALYLSCEMQDRLVAERLHAYAKGQPPPTHRIIDVTFGASVESLIGEIERHVSERPTLIVFDSLSSFADQAESTPEDDPFGMGPLRRLIMWAINVRRLSEGQISFMLLSEMNREGRAKGRVADHRADLAISMRSDDKFKSTKVIDVVKGWSYETGVVGEFQVDVGSWVLRRV